MNRAPRRSRISRRPLFDRRHGLRRLDAGWKRYGQDIADFPHLQRWLDAVLARPAVQRGLALDVPGRKPHDLANDEEARKILFGQRAR